jgi:hypothetical protein
MVNFYLCYYLVLFLNAECAEEAQRTVEIPKALDFLCGSLRLLCGPPRPSAALRG